MCLVMIIRKILESRRRLLDGRRYAAECKGGSSILREFMRGAYARHNYDSAIHGFSDNRHIHLQFAGAQRTHRGARRLIKIEEPYHAMRRQFALQPEYLHNSQELKFGNRGDPIAAELRPYISDPLSLVHTFVGAFRLVQRRFDSLNGLVIFCAVTKRLSKMFFEGNHISI